MPKIKNLDRYTFLYVPRQGYRAYRNEGDALADRENLHEQWPGLFVPVGTARQLECWMRETLQEYYQLIAQAVQRLEEETL